MTEKKLLTLIFALVVSAITVVVQASTIWYVNSTRGNNHNTGRAGWNNAKKDLQAAIEAANEGDQIWVAEGIYYPSSIPDSAFNASLELSPRDRAFYINKKLEIFGGFKGNENRLSDRRWENHPTILSGDIGVPGEIDDNCYHVVLISGVTDVRLDGFILSNGNANGRREEELKIIDKSSGRQQVIQISDQSGGGLYIINTSATLENFSILDNQSDYNGAGVFIFNSTSIIKNVIITNNKANDAEGGGIYFKNTVNTIEKAVIANNSATNGGGILADDSQVKLTNCLIANNESTQAGAGIKAKLSSRLDITACSIVQNVVSGFSENRGVSGSGISVSQSDLFVTNSIVQQNTVNGSSTAAEIDTAFISPKYSASIGYSFLQRNWSGAENYTTQVDFLDSTNAIGADGVWKTGDDGFVPTENSVVTGKGQSLSGLRDDITGLLRAETVDVGAYQYNPCKIYGEILYVNVANDSNLQDGASWATAFSKLQDALDIINKGCGSKVKEIWVAEGTYIPSKYPGTDSTTLSAKSFFLTKDVRLSGGFKGDESSLGGRDYLRYKTILSGQLNASTQARQVLVISGLDVNAVISGFHIENGFSLPDSILVSSYQIGTRKIDGNSGAGLYVDSSFAIIEDLVFTSNTAGSQGGGVFVEQGKPKFDNITLQANKAQDGGAMCFSSTTADILDIRAIKNAAERGGAIATFACHGISFSKVLLEGNTAENKGGGFYSKNSDIQMTSSVYSQNRSDKGVGGGLYAEKDTSLSDSIVITNCIFYENQSNLQGAGAFFSNAKTKITNSTWVGNIALGNAGGAIYSDNNQTGLISQLHIYNSIFRQNIANLSSIQPSSDVFAESGIETDFGHNLFQTPKSGMGNITGDPMFFSTETTFGSEGGWFSEAGGFMLKKGSPCIGTGNAAKSPERDITGRLWAKSADMGAYVNFCGGIDKNIIYVDARNTNTFQDGNTWFTAYSDLQRALKAALFNCDNNIQIWVKEGIYYPSGIPDSIYNLERGIHLSPRHRTFYIPGDLQVYGGFKGTETSLDERNTNLYPSVLSGDISNREDASDNAYHIMIVAALEASGAKGVVIDGFTFSDARADQDTIFTLSDGAKPIDCTSGSAFYLVSGQADINNCRFEHNTAQQNGGAVYIGGEYMSIKASTFYKNQARNGGAIALRNNQDDPLKNGGIFEQVDFTENVATSGGALYSFGHNYVLRKALFLNNTAKEGGAICNDIENNRPLTLDAKDVIFNGNTAERGGAIYDLSRELELKNAVFSNNTTSDKGGAIFFGESSDPFFIPTLALYSTTFAANKAADSGGAIYKLPSTTRVALKITNSIFFENSAKGDESAADADVVFNPESLETSYTFSNTFSCDTCFSGDPLFLSPNMPAGADGLFFTPDDGFALNESSPLRQQANWAQTPDTDIVGYPKDDFVADLGPYRYSPCTINHATKRVFVKAAQTNQAADGKSWATAYTNLQTALDVANASCIGIEEIWVAKGTYLPSSYPDSTRNAREGLLLSEAQKTFFLNGKAVKMYGGFSGSETTLDERILADNPTELWGLYGGIEDTTQKCYHIFATAGLSNLIIDGFSFKFAAPAPAPGFMYVNKVKVDHQLGGGIHFVNSVATLENNTFRKLKAQSGGAIYSKASDLMIANSLFENNTADSSGGAIAADSSLLRSFGNIYKGNSTDNTGGAIVMSKSFLETFDNIFESNTAINGGALAVRNQSTADISKSVFYRNKATSGNGGAICALMHGDKILLQNTLLAKNSSSRGGAVYFNDTLKANGVTIIDNFAFKGGGIYTPQNCNNQYSLLNTLFYKNTAVDEPFTSGDFADYSCQSNDIKYCWLQIERPALGNTNGHGDKNNFRNLDDLLGPDGKWMTHDDGANLLFGSGALGKGGDALPRDIVGFLRKDSSDIGAYEYAICDDFGADGPIYVNVANTNTFRDGTSWDRAFTDLQDALNLTNTWPCLKGREIWLAEGKYQPKQFIQAFGKEIPNWLLITDRDKSYVITQPVKIFGGFTEGDTSKTQRDPSKKSLIDGNIGRIDNPGDNTLNLLVVACDEDSILLDALDFENAYCDQISFSFGFTNDPTRQRLSGSIMPQGGAIFSSGTAKIYINNCNYVSNYAQQYGGAIATRNSVLKATASTFINNRTDQQDVNTGGGAIFLDYGSDPSKNLFADATSTFTSCIFENNRSGGRGGSIYFFNEPKSSSNKPLTKLVLSETNFSADSAAYGAAVYLYQSRMEFTGSHISHSKSVDAAIYATFSDIMFKKLSFDANMATRYGGALYADYMLRVQIDDSCTFSDNTSSIGGAIYLNTTTDSNTSFIRRSTFTSNTASSMGGAVYMENNDKKFEIGSCSFKANKAYTLGAGLALDYRRSTINILSSLFEDGIVSGNGGGIGFISGKLKAIGLTFNDNIAGGNGGGIYGKTVDISECHFINNRAENGAALALLEDTARSRIQNCTVEGNIARINGGAFHIDHNTIDNMLIGTSSFKLNEAAIGSGGAIFAKLGSGISPISFAEKLLIVSCVFEDNTALEADGGAVHIIRNRRNKDVKNRIELLKNIFERNRAFGGGAVSVSSESEFKIFIDKNIFHENEAENEGGALLIESKNLDFLAAKNDVVLLILTNNLFAVNSSNVEGAAVHASLLNKNVGYYVINNTFYANSSRSGIGSVALWLKKTDRFDFKKLTITNNLFANNLNNGQPAGNEPIANLVTKQDNVVLEEGLWNIFDDCFTESYSKCTRTDIKTDFTDVNNLKGADNIWRTEDDGLVPNKQNNLKNIGKSINLDYSGVLIEQDFIDITGRQREIPNPDDGRGSPADPGAYIAFEIEVSSIVTNNKWTISAYPNPFKNVLNIAFGEQLTTEIWVQVFDMQGRQVFGKTYQPVGLLLPIQLPYNLSSGMYVLQLMSGDKQAAITLVKE